MFFSAVTRPGTSEMDAFACFSESDRLRGAEAGLFVATPSGSCAVDDSRFSFRRPLK